MKIFTGTVVHTNMKKTAKVRVVRTMAHPVYGKRVKRTKQYLVHDELGVKAGDKVRFTDSRPVSKLKKWRIVDVVGDKKKTGSKK